MAEVQELIEFRNDVEWFKTNFLKLQKDFPNTFVAVKDKAIITHNKDFKMVLATVEDKGINTASILIEFVTKTGTITIL